MYVCFTYSFGLVFVDAFKGLHLIHPVVDIDVFQEETLCRDDAKKLQLWDI